MIKNSHNLEVNAYNGNSFKDVRLIRESCKVGNVFVRIINFANSQIFTGNEGALKDLELMTFI